MLQHTTLLLTLSVMAGFFMAWGIGANDVANAMGTSVGSKALTLFQAILIAAIFESAGALLAGGQVTQTMRGGIIDLQPLIQSPYLLVYGMLASLLAAGTWLIVASVLGWPVSTTHSIVGALIGFGAFVLGPQSVYWGKTLTIATTWIFSPMISGLLAYFIFMSIQFLIINTHDPFGKAKRYLPFYVFFAALVITQVTLLKGLKHLGLNLSGLQVWLGSIGISLLLAFISALLFSKIKAPTYHGKRRRIQYASVEKLFGILMIFTASCMAFAHGSNDVANAIGPLAAIVQVINSKGIINSQSPIPFWVMGLGALGIVAGLSMYGYKVIRTVGEKITELTPSRGFAAELATASTVIIASGIGLPVSTTQTLIGAVLGVGFARGFGALNLNVVRNIFLSWIITLPAGAGLAILFFQLLRAL